MIYLNVARDKKGRLLILSPQPPKGLAYVFPERKSMDPITRKIKAMWKEVDKVIDDRDAQQDKAQQNIICKMVNKYFGIDLVWISPNKDGWPTDKYWDANKRWFNNEIRKLAKG